MSEPIKFEDCNSFEEFKTLQIAFNKNVLVSLASFLLGRKLTTRIVGDVVNDPNNEK